MKKIRQPKHKQLKVKVETIKELRSNDLRDVVGGNGAAQSDCNDTRTLAA